MRHQPIPTLYTLHHYLRIDLNHSDAEAGIYDGMWSKVAQRDYILAPWPLWEYNTSIYILIPYKLSTITGGSSIVALSGCANTNQSCLTATRSDSSLLSSITINLYRHQPKLLSQYHLQTEPSINNVSTIRNHASIKRIASSLWLV